MLLLAAHSKSYGVQCMHVGIMYAPALQYYDKYAVVLKKIFV